MIDTYSDYIRRYLLRSESDKMKAPGEHHFVAAYLIPKLFAINGRVPDFINPDGMKNLNGDVVYLKNGKPELSIEVKLNTIRLTRSEFNDWIVELSDENWPHLFIGIGTNGVGIARWRTFRERYIYSVKKAQGSWWTIPLTGNQYGPIKSVNELLLTLGQEEYFPFSRSGAEASSLERRFIAALERAIPSETNF